MPFDEWLHSTAAQLDEYAQMTTVFRMPAFEEWAGETGGMIGLTPDKFKYTLGMLLAFPLAFIFTMLPYGTVRHLFSFFTGAFLAQFVLGSGWIHSLVSAACVYFIIASTLSIRALDTRRHILVFVFMMAYMTASHIYRIYVDYMGWTLDFTGPQMLLTIKLTSFAYSHFDGTVDMPRIKKELEDETASKGRRAMYSTRLRRSIAKLPNLLEYFGYVYCFTTYLAGPAFGIKEYLMVCNGTKHAKGEAVPSRWLTALSVTLQAFFFVGLMLWGEAHFPISNAFDKEWLAKTSDVSWRGWFENAGRVWLALFFIRAKYYFGWLLSEGSSIISGFGYHPIKKNWRGSANVDWFSFETAQSVRVGSRAWNQRTQTWLEECVYHRTNGSLLATYFVSAFWHGFYPGYYLFFLSVPLATTINRLAFKRLRPRFMNPDKTPKGSKWLYDLASMVATSLIMNYLAAVFQALSWENAVTVWTSWYFGGHVVMILMYIVLTFVIKAPKKKRTE